MAHSFRKNVTAQECSFTQAVGVSDLCFLIREQLSPMQNVRREQTINIGRVFPTASHSCCFIKRFMTSGELELSAALRIALKLADLDLVYLGQRM